MLNKANLTNSEIITLSGQNGYSGISYSKNDLMVFVYVNVKKSGLSDDMQHSAIMGTLPVGFRPPQTIPFSMIASYSPHGYSREAADLYIDKNGSIFATWKADILVRSLRGVACFPLSK